MYNTINSPFKYTPVNCVIRIGTRLMSLCSKDVGLNNLNPLIYFTHSQFCNLFDKDLLDEVKLLLY